MGHISHEPSMEEILSSIKRIISEDDGSGPRTRRARAATTTTPPPEPVAFVSPVDDGGVDADADEILELTDAMPVTAPEDQPRAAPLTLNEELVSSTAADASREALKSLSRMVVKPEDPVAENTLEALVRDMLRPMLKQWLDANLPAIVEAKVAREIDRISGKSL